MSLLKAEIVRLNNIQNLIKYLNCNINVNGIIKSIKKLKKQ